MIDYSIEKCFLVTKEDYVNMTVDKNSYLTPKENKIILRVMGMIAVCCGAAAFVSIRESIYQILCWLILILIGFYALSYYDVIAPVQSEKYAQKYYEYHRKQLESSVTLCVTEELFQTHTAAHQLCLPQKYIYQIIEGKHTILVFIDKNEFCFIPKRVLDDESLRYIADFAGDKYKKL